MTETSTQRPMGEIEPEQLAQRLAAGDSPVLLDVRESWEVAAAHLAGAVHIPMGALPADLDQLDPSRETIVFCHHGIRSRMVCQWLAAQGFKKVFNLSGGIDAWSMRMDPRVPRY